MSPPRISAAQTRANGWQVLPLPRGAKYPPPSGYTGKDGSPESVDVSVGHNYAIRLPDPGAHVIGTSGSIADRINVAWINRGREYIATKWAAATAGWPDMPELED